MFYPTNNILNKSLLQKGLLVGCQVKGENIALKRTQHCIALIESRKLSCDPELDNFYSPFLMYLVLFLTIVLLYL